MKTTPRSIRFTLEEWAAVADLARALRIETGDNISDNETLRIAVKATCKAKGVPWPK